jgi:hypothetical protein
MRPRRIALLLAVVGLLCLPAPYYLGWAAEANAPPPRTSQVYAAEPLDLDSETDRALVVQRHATSVALSSHQVSERYSAGEYRAPNETRRTLERAMETGSAGTADPAARADLRRIGQHHAFVYDAYADSEPYYRLRVRENGSLVEATPVSAARVANATAERATVRYDRLSPAARETVDRLLDNASTDDGYRPRVDAAFTDRLPALVRKDGTLYSLHVTAHVDDFGPGFSGFVVGLGVAGLGVVLLVAGGAIALVARLRDSPDD